MKLSRRKFLNLIATAAAGTTAFPLIAHSQDTKASEESGSRKKGLGMGANGALWPGMLTTLRCKWVYTWGSGVPSNLPERMDFIPMIRSRNVQPEHIASVAEQAKNHRITELLGLNEPDEKSQDNMSVEEALNMWPLLMETGLRLGSPGCVHPDREWMTQFMAGVEERKLRVDFVCVHSYGGPNPKALINRLENVAKLYERPLWITEFGVGDWAAKTVEENQYSPEIVLRFMEEVLPSLDYLDCLERYAWFPSMPDSPPLGTSALFDGDGVLTPLGEYYRDA
jgi:hypothetical protein